MSLLEGNCGRKKTIRGAEIPYTQKEKKLYRSLKKQYGARAEEVYHQMINSRKHDKVFGARTKRERVAKRKRGRKK